MLPIGQIALGLAQLVKLLLSANILVGIALLGAVVHTEPVHADSGAQVVSTSHVVFQSNYSVLTDTYSNSDEEKKHYVRPIIPAHFYKYHFIFALAMFFFIALITVSPSQTARALLLLPVVLSYGIAHILFAADQAEMVRDMMERYKRRISKKQFE
jgi:uncharacterized membrane protein